MWKPLQCSGLTLSTVKQNIDNLRVLCDGEVSASAAIQQSVSITGVTQSLLGTLNCMHGARVRSRILEAEAQACMELGKGQGGTLAGGSDDGHRLRGVRTISQQAGDLFYRGVQSSEHPAAGRMWQPRHCRRVAAAAPLAGCQLPRPRATPAHKHFHFCRTCRLLLTSSSVCFQILILS